MSKIGALKRALFFSLVVLGMSKLPSDFIYTYTIIKKRVLKPIVILRFQLTFRTERLKKSFEDFGINLVLKYAHADVLHYI